MEDKERLLTTILMFMDPSMKDHQYDDKTPDFGVYWAKPQVGDLVKCSTRKPHRWTWAWLVEHKNTRDDDCWLVRELAGEELCRVSNARLIALRGIPPEYLLEGAHHKFYLKVEKAFCKVDDRWCARFNGVSWPSRDSRVATISIRPHASLSPMGGGLVVVPVDFTFKHKSRTAITTVAETIREHTPDFAGWGERRAARANGSPFWVLKSAQGIELT